MKQPERPNEAPTSPPSGPTLMTESAGATIAIVHDWLPVLGGAEKVVQEMLNVFPGAPLYTLFDFLSTQDRQSLTNGAPIHTSALMALPGVQRYYRYLILAATRAIENFDLSRHEVVLSSAAAVSKGVITGPDQVHISYVHSPARYAWDLTHDYLSSFTGPLAPLKRALARRLLHRFRMWDMRTAPQVDHYLANSHFIKRRIWKTYRRRAEVLYPPVDTKHFCPSDTPKQDYFFTACRLVQYKRVDLLIAAFNERPDLQLLIGGDGPELPRLRAMARPNVTLLGHLTPNELRNKMQQARAFLFAGKEDFGIAPVEAQACGTPVIALNQGGTAETVLGLESPAPTGLKFSEQNPNSICKAIAQFETEEPNFNPNEIRNHALKFSTHHFHTGLRQQIEWAIEAHHQQ